MEGGEWRRRRFKNISQGGKAKEKNSKVHVFLENVAENQLSAENDVPLVGTIF